MEKRKVKPFNYKAVKSLKDIGRHPMVAKTANESHNNDGLWVYLMPGYINPEMECGIIHEHTIAELVEQLRDCKPA